MLTERIETKEKQYADVININQQYMLGLAELKDKLDIKENEHNEQIAIV